MPTASQLKALIKTHAEGDDERFYAIAMQVAAQAARQGHAVFARELRDLVDSAKGRHRENQVGPRARSLVQPSGELAGLLAASSPQLRFRDMVLDPVVERQIERVLVEQRQRSRIRSHGLSPVRKLLFIGPPGTGKTMTASVLAGELSLPLFTIQLDGLITKYLGETAAKLRLIFDSVREFKAVYLFDEFDSLGSERSTRNDVGEIRRVLNSFLQFLELDDSESLVVAATNHVQLLDKALFRRFDCVIEFRNPSVQVAERVLRARLSVMNTKCVEWSAILEASKGLSHADLTRACESAAKHAILANRNNLETSEIIDALRDRRAAFGT